MADITKSVWWLYQGRRVNTQSGAGGGALVTRFTIPAGQVARLVSVRALGPASNTTLAITSCDEDAAISAYMAYISAGVARIVNIPSVGTASTSHDNQIMSDGEFFGPGQIVSINSAAALQNETLTVAVVLLLSTPTAPTWDTTGSGGTPSLAASTISAANTLQLVVI